ncbi:MAG: MmgE/PrpD family protein [Candidatus Bathyarchaeia archaeon]
MSVLDKWIEHILCAKYEQIDDNAIRWAKIRILDVIGCIAAGVQAPGNPEIVELVESYGGTEQATIFFYKKRAPLIWAAMVNSITARSLDYGPVDPEFEEASFPGHLSETTIPTALNVGEFLKSSGREVLIGLIVAEDLACRLIAASRYNPQMCGWNNISIANAFAVTALYGRLSGLEPRELRNAFGILLDLLSGTFQNTQDRCTAFKLCQGVAAKNGIFAVELARRGWTGSKDPLFSRYGYFKMFTQVVWEEPLLKDLGQKYYTDRTIKPYPACRLTHAGIDCALLIRAEQNIEVDQIEEVVLYISPNETALSIAEPFQPGDFPEADVIFNYRYPIATALVEGTFKPIHHQMKFVNNPLIRKVANTIRIEPSDCVKSFLAAGLKVKFKNRQEILKTVEVPKGDRRRNPLTEDEIKQKFVENLQYSNKTKIGEEILEHVENLEKLENISDLTKLLQ